MSDTTLNATPGPSIPRLTLLCNNTFRKISKRRFETATTPHSRHHATTIRRLVVRTVRPLRRQSGTSSGDHGPARLSGPRVWTRSGLRRYLRRLRLGVDEHALCLHRDAVIVGDLPRGEGFDSVHPLHAGLGAQRPQTGGPHVPQGECAGVGGPAGLVGGGTEHMIE